MNPQPYPRNSAASVQILCVMNMPPDLDGHGGSQRAWRLVEALRPYGSIHFVLVYNDSDRVCIDTSLVPLEPFVASITRVKIPEWRGRKGKLLKVFHPKILDVAKFGSIAAPHFSLRTLKSVADHLPIRNPDIIFAGRITCAVIVQSMIDRKLLSARRKVVDFDDVLSKFRRREVDKAGPGLGFQGRLLGKLDAYLIAREERRIAHSWHSVSVCSNEDVATLSRQMNGVNIVKIPNVVAHDALPARSPDGQFRCLFVGNLSFSPNVHGLLAFMQVAWPSAKRAIPRMTLDIVGFNPSEEVLALAKIDGVTVHANAPSLRPFYKNCDVVLAPILFGGGTRVKIVEAMAYGRAVVSTRMGAEGLSLEDFRNIRLVETLDEFPSAMAELARDSALRSSIASEARAFQEQHFGLPALAAAMPDFIGAL
jgi:glycosyltransferase involved in cell wall biosynthesis